MGDAKKAVTAVATGGLSLIGEAAGGFSTGKSAAKRAQKAQQAQIAEQQKIEKQRAAEATSEVERRKAVATRGRGGRQSLIATSQTGLATNLGGTSNGAA